MKESRLTLEIWIARDGLWFVPGLILLVLAAWAWWFWLPAREAQLQSVLDQVAAAAQKSQAPVQESGRDQAMDEAVDPYPQVQKIFDLAAAQGLQIAQTEYRRLEAGRTGRLQMQLPARGTYPQIRHFLREVQANMPAVSIDEMGVRRNDQGVEAKLLFSIWYVVPQRKEGA